MGAGASSEEVGCANLIAARGGERGRQKRKFDLAQNAMIEPCRRQAVLEFGKIRGKVALDPVLGRFSFAPHAAELPRRGIWVSYHTGFCADMGGGEYNRRC